MDWCTLSSFWQNVQQQQQQQLQVLLLAWPLHRRSRVCSSSELLLLLFGVVEALHRRVCLASRARFTLVATSVDSIVRTSSVSRRNGFAKSSVSDSGSHAFAYAAAATAAGDTATASAFDSEWCGSEPSAGTRALPDTALGFTQHDPQFSAASLARVATGVADQPGHLE